jgi:outer membrane protein TolC
MRKTIACIVALAAPASAQKPVTLLEAVRTTLELQPEIKTSTEDVQAARGTAVSFGGQFDLTLNAQAGQRGETIPQTMFQQTINGGLKSISTETTSYSLGASKQFRFGLSIAPSLSLARTAEDLVDPSFGNARVVFAARQPLLRGRGASVNAAQETSAWLTAEQQLATLRHTVARRASTTAQAYWSYAAAHQAVEILKAAEERARVLLSEEAELVKAGEHPPSELRQLEANYADQKAARVDGERLEIEGRQALGLAMGLAWRDIDALGPPADPLATVEEAALPGQSQPLVELALAERSDRAAARTAIRAADVLVVGARRSLEPQLDLLGELGYNGLTESNGASPFITPFGDNVRGVNFFGGLAFSYPVGNHAARGQVVANEALRKKAAILADDLDRTIASNVSTEIASLRAAVLAARSADEAVVAYRAAVENERKKQRAGLSTIFDVILTQQHLTAAEQQSLRARTVVAQRLSLLRFETGTLVSPASDGGAITAAQLTTVPR